MKKILGIMAAIYMTLCFAVVGWMFGCPESYGRWMNKWVEKINDGLYED